MTWSDYFDSLGYTTTPLPFTDSEKIDDSIWDDSWKLDNWNSGNLDDTVDNTLENTNSDLTSYDNSWDNDYSSSPTLGKGWIILIAVVVIVKILVWSLVCWRRSRRTTITYRRITVPVTRSVAIVRATGQERGTTLPTPAECGTYPPSYEQVQGEAMKPPSMV